MFRIKTGVFAIDFIDSSNLASFFNRLEHYPEVEFQVYTSLPGSRLNGGRPNTFILHGKDVYNTTPPYHTQGAMWGKLKDLEKRTIEAIKTLNKRGVRVSFALTNHFVEDKDLEDPYFLRVLDFLADQSNRTFRNDITYVDDSLREFILKRYGSSLSITASTIKFSAEPRLSYEDGLKLADDIVLTPQDGLNDDVLMSIPECHRNRVFIITNSGCRRACSKFDSDRHYRATSFFNNGVLHGLDYRCRFEDYPESCNIDPKRFQELVEMGYPSFKLGRLDYKGGMAEFSVF